MWTERCTRPSLSAPPARPTASRASPLAASLAASPVALLAALLLAGCATVLTGPGPADDGRPSPPSLGFFSNIKVPDGHDVVLKLAAAGVQVFRCEARAADWIWVFRLPEADLRDEHGAVVARHGAGFTFEHVDGSRLVGNVIGFDEAPGRDNLRWLLLSARAFGTGAFERVSHVQRVNTAGGMPPERCEASQKSRLLRVPFSADFVFYRPR
jgi:hypothetical protein